MASFKPLFVVVLVFGATLMDASFAVAQPTDVGGEFIESSSPLRNGGTVTTRAEPGRRVQTTVTIASTRGVAPTRGAVNGQSRVPTPASNGSSVLQSGTSSTRQAAGQSGLRTTNQTSSRYPYPATYQPRVAYNPYAGNQYAMNAARVQLPQNGNCNCAPLPVNGLGLTPAPTYNNQLGGTRVPTNAYQPNGAFGAQNGQPVLSQPPQIQYQIPGQTPAAPQYGYQNPNYAQSPWLTGSPGAYQPLVRVFNPQGAFLGQGVMGQPEAYVNGQPVANFFRYWLPF